MKDSVYQSATFGIKAGWLGEAIYGTVLIELWTVVVIIDTAGRKPKSGICTHVTQDTRISANIFA